MIRKTMLAMVLVGIILGFSISSCSGQIVYVYEPIVNLYWTGANIDGFEVPADLTASYHALQRPKGETSWANADTVMSNTPHTVMDIEYSQDAVIAGFEPGTYEHLIVFVAQDSTGQVISTTSCETNEVMYLPGEGNIPGCGARRRE